MSVVFSPTVAILRRATFDDREPVSAFLGRLGLRVPVDSITLSATWERLWRDNPALGSGRREPTIGWVLEAPDTKIVGFFGSIPMRYQFGPNALVAGVARQWAVEKPYREQTNDLARAFFEQPDVDLLLGTTVNRSAGRVFTRFGSRRIPHPDYDRVLFWVTDAAGFAHVVLRQKAVPQGLSAIAEVALSPLKAVGAALLPRPGRLRAGLEPEVIQLEDVGDDFDELWRAKLMEGIRLYASRTAEDVRWRFGQAAANDALTVIRCRRAGRLAGYLILSRERVPEVGLVRARIADLFVERDDLTVIDSLLSCAHEDTVGRRCHVLEFVGMPTAIRRHVVRYVPFSRRFPSSPFYYKTLSPQLEQPLTLEESWYPTWSDGDGCFGP